MFPSTTDTTHYSSLQPQVPRSFLAEEEAAMVVHRSITECHPSSTRPNRSGPMLLLRRSHTVCQLSTLLEECQWEHIHLQTRTLEEWGLQLIMTRVRCHRHTEWHRLSSTQEFRSHTREEQEQNSINDWKHSNSSSDNFLINLCLTFISR